MAKRDQVCLACDGTGLQADDEEWKYPCTVCGGDGMMDPGDNPNLDEPFDIDPTNRTLE